MTPATSAQSSKSSALASQPQGNKFHLSPNSQMQDLTQSFLTADLGQSLFQPPHPATKKK
jgi:hypothetical protein